MSEYTIVVDKSDSRLVFVMNAHQPQLFDALWPTVQYNYAMWVGELNQQQRERPWNYVFQGNNLVASEPGSDYAANAAENTRRAHMLIQVARATNRHRRMVLKEDLIGQDLVYQMKTDEAQRFLADTTQNVDGYPWLLAAANFDNVTVTQAAHQVMFRYTQATQVLQHTENRRRYLTRRILTVPVTKLETVQSELTDYERRG